MSHQDQIEMKCNHLNTILMMINFIHIFVLVFLPSPWVLHFLIRTHVFILYVAIIYCSTGLPYFPTIPNKNKCMWLSLWFCFVFLTMMLFPVHPEICTISKQCVVLRDSPLHNDKEENDKKWRQNLEGWCLRRKFWLTSEWLDPVINILWWTNPYQGSAGAKEVSWLSMHPRPSCHHAPHNGSVWW